MKASCEDDCGDDTDFNDHIWYLYLIYGICIWRLWKRPCEDDCDDENEVEGLSGCQKVGPVPLPEALSAKYAFLPLLGGSFKKVAEIFKRNSSETACHAMSALKFTNPNIRCSRNKRFTRGIFNYAGSSTI